jgi:hypothetical protein
VSAVNCERYIVRNATALSAFMALLALAVSAPEMLPALWVAVALRLDPGKSFCGKCAERKLLFNCVRRTDCAMG